MLQQYGILAKIENEIDSFTSSYKQIVRVILDHPKDIKFMSISSLAELSGVSDPTVVRFCRLLGFDGFKEFKLQLAEEEGLRKDGLFHVEAPEFITQMGRAAISAITEVVETIDPGKVDAAIARFAKAKKIEFWGQCASAGVAQDAYNKFFAAGISCYVNTENTMQKMSAGLFTSDNVVVAISHTGVNVDLIKNIELAKKQGAFILGISLENSPVAQACSETIGINISEKGDLLSAMVLRVAHVFVLDILAVGTKLYKDALNERDFAAESGVAEKIPPRAI